MNIEWAIKEKLRFDREIRRCWNSEEVAEAKRNRSLRRRAARLSRSEYAFWRAEAERALAEQECAA